MAAVNDGPVLVTGASGFIALHTIQVLQREGYRVRGTVRSLKNEDKTRPLKSLCPEAKHQLELVEADLTRDAGWKDAVKGCVYVIHVASPFPNAPPKEESDLLRPAVDGTKRVLRACADAGTVKRVVLTSSIGSIHGESTAEKDRLYTEDDWSDVNSPAIDAYAKSKTLAERAAWNFVQELPPDQKFELSVINPGLVMGPVISGVVCTSIELIKRLMDGSMPLIPRINLCLCDVRDVAAAHLKAMTIPEAANQRHLIVASHLWLRDVAFILSEEFGSQGYYIPTWHAPYFTLWLYSFFDNSTRLILSRINKSYTYSNRKMIEVLGINPRDMRKTLLDTVHCLIACGALKKTEKI